MQSPIKQEGKPFLYDSECSPNQVEPDPRGEGCWMELKIYPDTQTRAQIHAEVDEWLDHRNNPEWMGA